MDCLSHRQVIVFMLMGTAIGSFGIGCQNAEDPQSTERFADRDPKGLKEEPKLPPKGDRFAEDRAMPDVKAVPFDGKRAMQYLNDLCAIGPRISGSDGMLKQQDLLKKHFEKLGANVDFQKFDGKQPGRPAVAMANMIITWNPDAKRRIIFCGHYDTKPIADQEARERDWHKPFLSANDGTSTVAFLMELGHHVKDIPLKVGVDFVIFDGEEYINDKDRDRFFLGSIYFGEQYVKNPPAHRYLAAVLLDLFAGKDATFPVEANSLFKAGEVVESIWKEAERQGVKSFVWKQGPEVMDDHLALNRARIPAVDIIDFSYKHWHKLTDLPDQCSGETMADVAKVLTAWVQRLR